MKQRCRSERLRLLVLVLPVVVAFHVRAGESLEYGCGSLKGGYGPYDYRVEKGKLGIVEEWHFDAGVEHLRRGKSGRIGGDLDYTLRAFPNHPRALLAMIALGQREKRARPLGANYTVECYLKRAEAFRPDDAIVRVIYGMYLIKSGDTQAALEKLEQARARDESDANVQYNLGLAYFDLGRFDESLASAHKAYRLGFPLSGLRDKLQRAGHWRADAARLSSGAAAAGNPANPTGPHAPAESPE